ncbi:EamA family transporter RarD [Tritonibacter horizontis]|uniref:EamA-like transporter family protein n=1 Tax=Tritonibacter horizontis TaxID=1768241 RepID=A0A132BYF9_9RHOB|nr:EamA family transporter RarD [Tritonibacter horizontis]KUP92847.1 EamA-like transporter family protein [Tritonibacter horizontis]
MSERPENIDTPQGLAFALSAYVFWGFLPLFMKLLAHIPPAEVVAHRVIWSVPIAGALLIFLGRFNELQAALKNPKMLLMGCVTAAFVSVNWGIYVWAVASGHALEAALGYYINPLFSIALGAAVLGERLSRAQFVAVGLAALAVVILTVEAGRLPLAALGLTLSWGAYAFFKKWLPIGPNQGFLLEVLILTPPALGYLCYLALTGQGHFAVTQYDTLLLLGTGAVTALPLIVYANGAKLLKLSTIAILQYIAPTLIFLVAVLVFKEPFGGARLIAFPLIWIALVIYSISLFRGMRRSLTQVVPPTEEAG